MEAAKAPCWHRVSWAMLMRWWLAWSALKVYCGQGWSQVLSVAASRGGRSVQSYAAEACGTREVSLEAAVL